METWPYDGNMRCFLVILMVVLLPLRSWAGGLVSDAVQITQSGCPFHAQADEVATAQDKQAPAGIDQCTACQLCVAFAAAPDPRIAVLTDAGHAKPLMGRIDFVSAPRAQAFKPPIS